MLCMVGMNPPLGQCPAEPGVSAAFLRQLGAGCPWLVEPQFKMETSLEHTCHQVCTIGSLCLILLFPPLNF